MSPTKSELTLAAKEWAAAWYQDFKEHDAAQSDLTREDADTREEVFADWLYEARESYALNNTFKVSKTAKSLFSEETYIDAQDIKQLCQEINAYKVKVYSLFLEKYRSGTPLPNQLFPNTDNRFAEDATTAPQYSISSIWGKYKEDKKASGEWARERTEKGNDLSYRILIEILGDIQLSGFDKNKARELKETLLIYPAQREKLSSLQGLPLMKILEDKDSYKPISRQTAQNHFIKVTAFMNWATSNGYIEQNPLDNMSIKSKKSSKESRMPFGQNDLLTVFGSKVFTENKHLHDYYYWLPLIALHTGARIEEICQLHLSDIKEIDDILCFNISDEQPDQQLKNKSSKRLIPVHTKLIELGLMEYIGMRKTTGENMLLPSLDKISERYSHMPSKWFGRFKNKLGIESSTKTFHSFRHSFIDKLRQLHAPDYALKEIVGHSDGSTTHSVYGSNNPKPLKPVIDSIDWSEVLQNVQPFGSQ